MVGEGGRSRNVRRIGVLGDYQESVRQQGPRSHPIVQTIFLNGSLQDCELNTWTIPGLEKNFRPRSLIKNLY